MNPSIRKECIEEASKIIMMTTGETEGKHNHRMLHDAVYRTVLEHIADLYYLIKTNEHFQTEQHKRFIEMYQNFIK